MFTFIVGRSNSAVLVELYAVRSTIEIAFPSVCLSVSVSVRELCPNGGFLLVSVCGRPLTWICCKKKMAKLLAAFYPRNCYTQMGIKSSDFTPIHGRLENG